MNDQQNIFQFRAIDGKLNLGSEYNRGRLQMRLKQGGRGHIYFDLPESNQQRRFYEGAILPLYTFFQEGMDYRNWEDVKRVREWLAQEFNGQMVYVKGKPRIIGQSTKGNKALNTMCEKIIDDLVENYGIDQEAVLNPVAYQKWRDEVFPFGGPDNYIDVLLAEKKLNKKLSTGVVLQ